MDDGRVATRLEFSYNWTLLQTIFRLNLSGWFST